VPSLGFDAASAGFERLAMSPYAAMPSGHAAFSLIAAGTVAVLARRRIVRLAALLYPPAVLLEIVATGNHFWLDAAAGAAAAAAGFAMAQGIDRGYPPARSRRRAREGALTGASPSGGS
jgi:membrane-associated phospholipid phosphatase